MFLSGTPHDSGVKPCKHRKAASKNIHINYQNGEKYNLCDFYYGLTVELSDWFKLSEKLK